MKTAKLTGAKLNEWVAKASGVGGKDEAYAPSPISKEAAAEIVRPRKAAEECLSATEFIYDSTDDWIHESLYVPMCNLRKTLDNKKPAEAG